MASREALEELVTAAIKAWEDIDGGVIIGPRAPFMAKLVGRLLLLRQAEMEPVRACVARMEQRTAQAMRAAEETTELHRNLCDVLDLALSWAGPEAPPDIVAELTETVALYRQASATA